MAEHNQGGQNGTKVTEFILLGFPGSQNFHTFLFVLFLIMYILTMTGNLSIIILVIINSQLHTPMYFLLSNLSFIEICYTTTIVPKTLAIFLGRNRSISYLGCLMQLYFLFSFGGTEHFLLSVMAYDRYLAICYPLHYITMMDINLSCKLATCCWMCAFLFLSVPVSLISRLSFCGPNVINHFYCNTDSWIVLSCSDTHVFEIVAFVLSVMVILCSCMIILLSYVYIISTILRISSAKGKQKALSTCSSHLAVVILWYGPTIFLYCKPSKVISSEMTKIVNILNTFVTPLLNPFIYTLRNKEVKEAFKNSLSRS